jgi:hypothetical protein
VFEADFSRTERRAWLDGAIADRAAFARSSIEWARQHDAKSIVWHFAAKDSIAHLDRDPHLSSIAKTLQAKGRVRVGDVEVILATKRKHGPEELPCAAWWTDDRQLLALDSTHRPVLDAFLSQTHRAPIWLTAFELSPGVEVGVKDPDSGLAGEPTRVVPIAVSDELLNVITTRSSAMTLSSNGVHDSLGPQFLAAARGMIRSGAATPEAVAVAALRAGWWPRHIPALLQKLESV